MLEGVQGLSTASVGSGGQQPRTVGGMESERPANYPTGCSRLTGELVKHGLFIYQKVALG